MEQIKAELQALREIQQNSQHGWEWSYDEVNGIIRAKQGSLTRKVFAPHIESLGPTGSPTPWTRNQSRFAAEALNTAPKMLDALERTLSFLQELDTVAKRQEQDADLARKEDRHEAFNLHLQSSRLIRAIKQALLEELNAAFPQSPKPPRLPPAA